jgi:hypothetical protein
MSRFILTMLFLIPSGSASAQDSAEPASVLAVVGRLFDGMRARDSTAVRSVFAPGARLLRVAVRDGTPSLVTTTVDEFVNAVGSAPSPVWDERIYDPEVRVDDRLATVWTSYDFLAGTRWSHCGVDAFMLAKLADGWRITQLADTMLREGCTTPAATRAVPP